MAFKKGVKRPGFQVKSRESTRMVMHLTPSTARGIRLAATIFDMHQWEILDRAYEHWSKSVDLEHYIASFIRGEKEQLSAELIGEQAPLSAWEVPKDETDPA